MNRMIITVLIATFCNCTAKAGVDTDSIYVITKDRMKHMYVAEDIILKSKDSFSFKNGNGKVYANSDIVAGSYDAAKKKDKTRIVEYRRIDENFCFKMVSGVINIYKYDASYYANAPGSDRAYDRQLRSKHLYYIQKGDLEDPVEVSPGGITKKERESTNDKVYKMFSDHTLAKAILDASIEKKKYISWDAIMDAAKACNGQ